MAVVTGMTAAAMQAIRDNTVVSAAFDSANHLILTKYDGSVLDGGTLGSATATVMGQVELATSAETQTGTDTTRAVTPAGLASVPGYKVQIVSGIAESATPAVWPYATSLQSVSAGSGWTPNGGAGTVVTESIDSTRTAQTFYENSGGTASTKAWVREYNSAVGGGGWTAWAQMMLAVRLNEVNFTQLTAMSSYPSGRSFLYYTTANSASWDFAGTAGVVETMFLVDKNYAAQTFTQHVAGSTNTPNVWIRTSDNATGWSAWKKLLASPGAWTVYTPAWTGSTTNPAIVNGTLTGRYIKLDRTVHCEIYVSAGSTTTFGAGTYGFGVPFVKANAVTESVGSARFSSGSTYIGQCSLAPNSSSVSATFPSSATPATAANMTPTLPATFASGNILRMSLTYESAT